MFLINWKTYDFFSYLYTNHMPGSKLYFRRQWMTRWTPPSETARLRDARKTGPTLKDTATSSKCKTDIGSRQKQSARPAIPEPTCSPFTPRRKTTSSPRCSCTTTERHLTLKSGSTSDCPVLQLKTIVPGQMEKSWGIPPGRVGLGLYPQDVVFS